MKNYKEKRTDAIKQLFPKPVSGKGFVNSLIDNLPFEAHPLDYNYLGPGTNLALRLEKRVKPKNKLDEAAMNHDIAYSKSKDLAYRHIADKILQETAWKRVKASDASIGEKAMAWLTTNTMRAKRALGAGLKKSSQSQYTPYPVNLEEYDKTAIISASENKKPLEINVNLFRTKASIMNETSLPLTTYQIKKLKKAQKEGKNTIKLKLSVKQLQHYKQGGFLPALLAAVPAIATLGSMASNVYNAYQNKKTNDRLIEERIRHNKVSEGKGLKNSKRRPKRKAKQSGMGVYMNRKPRVTSGNGLLEELLKKKKKLR